MAKIEKRRRRGFTIASNGLIRDEKLSWKARGIFMYLWSQSADWDFYETEVVDHSKPDGKASLKSGLKELEEQGYLARKRVRDDKGRLRKSDWILSDSPMSDFPTLDKPMLEKPTLENRTLRSTNNKNNQSKEVPTEINTSSSAPDLTDVKSRKTRKRVYSLKDPEFELAAYLFQQIKLNNPEAKTPNVQSWANDMRLMIERDHRKPAQVKNMIDWCQHDAFWMTNILSPKKLREKYDQMRLKALKQYEPDRAVLPSLPADTPQIPMYDWATGGGDDNGD